MRTHSCPIAVVVIALIAGLPSSAQLRNAAPTEPVSAGGIQWSAPTPADSGFDAAALESIYSEMAQETNHDLKGIVIVRGGHLVSEHYFNGDSAISLHDIRSATKSLTSLLMGIAIQKNLVHSVDDPISLYLPGLPKDGKEKITIKDLLNMRSGLDADDGDPASPGNEDTLDQSSDWIRTVYSVPMKHAPGMQYLIARLMHSSLVQSSRMRAWTSLPKPTYSIPWEFENMSGDMFPLTGPPAMAIFRSRHETKLRLAN
jgi:CubicO group peptidase (beta-lactamase class C family)